MELITAIALLCQVGVDGTYLIIDKQQLKCQQWYLECVGTNMRENTHPQYLVSCIKKRKL